MAHGVNDGRHHAICITMDLGDLATQIGVYNNSYTSAVGHAMVDEFIATVNVP